MVDPSDLSTVAEGANMRSSLATATGSQRGKRTEDISSSLSCQKSNPIAESCVCAVCQTELPESAINLYTDEWVCDGCIVRLCQ